jgi:hypothetical protein
MSTEQTDDALLAIFQKYGTGRFDGFCAAVEAVRAPDAAQVAPSTPFPNGREFADGVGFAVTDEWVSGWQACKQLMELRGTHPPAAQADESSEIALIMERNAWRAALIGLCQGSSETHATPETAAESVRRRLRPMGAP